MGHITQYQLDNARFELALHSRELPVEMTKARDQLRAHVNEVLGHVRCVQGHRWHPQWLYHLWHYRWRLERKWVRSRILEITSEIERVHCKLSNERELIELHLSGGDRDQALRYLEEERAGRLQALRADLASLEARPQIPAQPQERNSSISRPALVDHWAHRHLQNWIRQISGNRELRVLAVCPVYSSVFKIFEDIPGCHIHLSPESFIEGGSQMLPDTGRHNFDVCVIELTDRIMTSHTKDVLDAVARHVTMPGTILVHCHNWGAAPLKSIHSQIVEFALDQSFNVVAQYVRSSGLAYIARALSQVKNKKAWRHPLRLMGLAALAVFANLRVRMQEDQVTSISKYYSGVVFKIETKMEEVVEHLEATIPPASQKLVSIQARRGKRGATKERDGRAANDTGLSDERVIDSR
jgi:hypothetical protein